MNIIKRYQPEEPVVHNRGGYIFKEYIPMPNYMNMAKCVSVNDPTREITVWPSELLHLKSKSEIEQDLNNIQEYLKRYIPENFGNLIERFCATSGEWWLRIDEDELPRTVMLALNTYQKCNAFNWSE